MKPLPISAFSIVTALGEDQATHASALRAGISGLQARRFETATLDAWLGVVDALDGVRLPTELSRFDCRNNRLAALALRSDGFDARVREAAARHGAHRVGVMVGTSTSGILQSEIAYRERASDALSCVSA